ncbi:MAG: methionyl-tRNA formyltransferase [Deltaproteobacteria bacterium]|nr:methionyl-tRNA formyltransferase [Deltaproteobacteria bacterium]
MKPRIVFLGSPAAAVPSLRAAARLGDVVGVLSQPDRPAGRGRHPQPPPVALAARELDLPLHQPAKVRTPDVVELLEGLRPDVILVVAYGKILPPAILRVAPRGCVNVHFSLLPRHRGAAPVAHAILAGDERSGVTLMVLDEGMDTGPVLVQRAVPIGESETAGELTERLATLGAELVESELPKHLAGELAPQRQASEGATLAPMLRKGDGAVRWDRPAAEVDRQVRAVTPWPGAYGFVDGRRWIVHRARPLPGVPSAGPGVLRVEGRHLTAGALDVSLELLELQREGSRRMSVAEFLAGSAPPAGATIRPGPGAAGE